MASLEQQQRILELLKSLRGPDALKRLFSELNYNYANKSLSKRQFGEATQKQISSEPTLLFTAGEDDNFGVIYVRLESDGLARTIQRPIIQRLIQDHPYSLFVFSNSDESLWHFVNVKYDSKSTRRKLFRRITVGEHDRLRTASERLAMLDVADIEQRKPSLFGLSALDVQDAHDQAFDVETVTKKFYGEIASWYFWALKYVRFPKDAPKHDGKDHIAVIRLITRLIFCWFVKEKGLIPDALFDAKKLRTLLKSGDRLNASKESTYYKAVLQNLFFATLNQEIGRREFRKRNKNSRGQDPHWGITNLFRYKELFQDSRAFLDLIEAIPFLNGGLFECLDKRELKIEIDGFSDHPKNALAVPDFLFFGDDREVDLTDDYADAKHKRVNVRGLIHTFEQYNFTVVENTPLDEEVALDPELAGKVFENLLAAYNPETATTARKQTGSFYTPREIVNYMVDEALIAQLESKLITEDTGDKKQPTQEKLRHLFAYNDEAHQFSSSEVDTLIEAIDSLKALDPACGSGAFPMGLLHKLVSILGKLDPHNERWKEIQIGKARQITDVTVRDKTLDQIEKSFAANELDYGRKLYLIKNCIYGVDIQTIAVQIAKMRFFISLIVDQRIDAQEENLGIDPLPNLETNFVAANTLIGIEKPAQQMLRNPQIDEKEDQLRQVRERHFTARTPTTKAKYRELDASLRAEIAELLRADGFPRETTEKLANWDPYNQNVSADFFDPEWMFNIPEGFDIVIGNPPYIKEYTRRAAFDGIRESAYYQGKMDVWYFFACLALDQLRKDSGILTFIATNNWVTSAGASILRAKIADDATILKLLDFGDYKIFESADIQTMIFIIRRSVSDPKYSFDLRILRAPHAEFSDVLDLLSMNDNPSADYLPAQFGRKELRTKPFVFTQTANESVLTKICEKGNFVLNATKEVAQGIVTPQDSVNAASKQTLGDGVKIGDGIFVLSDAEKNDLALSEAEKVLLRPFYTTTELTRYFGCERNNRWLIYTDSSYKDPKNIRSFPTIKKHLDRFKKVITSDNWPYGLHRARNEKFFNGEKVIALRKCVEPTFTYTDFDCYVSQTFNVIKTRRLNAKYLVGLLNSKLVRFWLRHKGKMQGHHFQIDKEPLLAIPIYAPKANEQNPIITIVDRILALKRKNRNANINDLECEIDRHIYALYGLTDEEIALVEGNH